MKNMTECARNAVLLDGEISKHVYILQGVTQGCALSPNLFKIYTNELIVAIEAARRGVTQGEDTVSELMFADEFMGDIRNHEGL